MTALQSLGMQAVVSIVLLIAAGAPQAQDYPNRTIRIITGTAGSNVANSTRIIAQGISPALGQPVVVDNRGGGAVVHAELVSKSPADGYTLLLTGNGFWTGPLLREKPPYDPIGGFSPISLVASAPGLIVVHPSLPVKTAADLIALARNKPGQLNYSSGGDGGISHISAEVFKAMAGINMVRVRYSNDAVSVADLLTGQIGLTFAATNVMSHVKAGKLRAIGITGDQPSALFPGVPPAATSLPGYSVLATNAMFAPARTSGALIQRLNQEVARVLSQSATRELFHASGLEPSASTPERLSALIKGEMETVARIIRSAGIRLE